MYELLCWKILDSSPFSPCFPSVTLGTDFSLSGMNKRTNFIRVVMRTICRDTQNIRLCMTWLELGSHPSGGVMFMKVVR